MTDTQKTYFDLMVSDAGFNYRWIQPPQIAYLVSTMDENGNNNLTPVTLGTCVGVNSLSDPVESNYYFAFSVGSASVPDIPVRNAFHNLKVNPECVIAYPGADLLEKIWITGLPLPEGIEEVHVAQLHPLQSKQVKPTGVAECPVNIEARVVNACKVGDHYHLFICQALGVSVNADLIEKDNQNPLHYGVLEFDPLFEVAIASREGRPPRLYFGKIDRDNLIRTSDDIGSSKKWMGTFEEWVEDTYERGIINLYEKEDILILHDKWKKHPDPVQNADIKKRLTESINKMIWNRRR